MFVRVTPDKGDPLDFEFDFEFSSLTPDIKKVAKEVIAKESGIQPDKQNAIFFPVCDRLLNAKKLYLPPEIVQSPQYKRVELDESLGELQSESTIYLSRIGVWSEEDFLKPQNRILEARGQRAAGKFLSTLFKELNKPRTVHASLLETSPNFRDYIEQEEVPSRRFLGVVPPESPASVTRRELRCYEDIFNDIENGVAKFPKKKFDSSPMHTIFFGSVMIKPPFFWDEHESSRAVEMSSNHTSGLRVFLKGDDERTIYKHTPRSDLIIIDETSTLPTLICEVDSNTQRRDCTRMILEGVVACRQWRYVLPQSHKDKNRLLALFVHKKFNVALYLFHADRNNTVKIYSKNFDLGDHEEALRLSRILFNYRDKQQEIAAMCAQEKVGRLEELYSRTKHVPSLSLLFVNATPQTCCPSDEDP